MGSKPLEKGWEKGEGWGKMEKAVRDLWHLVPTNPPAAPSAEARAKAIAECAQRQLKRSEARSARGFSRRMSRCPPGFVGSPHLPPGFPPGFPPVFFFFVSSFCVLFHTSGGSSDGIWTPAKRALVKTKTKQGNGCVCVCVFFGEDPL